MLMWRRDGDWRVSISRARNRDHEPRSTSLFARDRNVAVVSPDQLLYDGQAHAASSGLSNCGSPPEAIEDVLDVLCGDSPPRVFYDDRGESIL